MGAIRRGRRCGGGDLVRGTRRLGARDRGHRATSKWSSHVRVHAGQHRRSSDQHRRVARTADQHRHRRRSDSRRDRSAHPGPPRASEHHLGSVERPRARPHRQPHPPGLVGGRNPRSRHPARADPGPADAQTRGDRDRHVLSPSRSCRADDEAQWPARLALVRRLGGRAGHRHRLDAVGTRRVAERSGGVPRAPLRRGAPDGRHPDPVEARELDARTTRFTQTPGPRLHGRGVRVRATHRRSPVEKAHPDAVQAGSGVRGRCGVGDTEPGRSRLQGHLECGHMDGGAPADRARQGPTARWNEQRGRHGRSPVGRRHDLGARQTRVPVTHHRGQGAADLRGAMGHVVSGRPVVERSGRPTARHGGTQERTDSRAGCRRAGCRDAG